MSGTGGESFVVADELSECALELVEGSPRPIDLLLMVDQTISMINNSIPDDEVSAPTRWEFLTQALDDYFANEASTQVIALDFFPQSGDTIDPSCDFDDYQTPEVDFDILGDGRQALMDALGPPEGGLTPSYPALDGALRRGQEWASGPGNEERGTAVVLITDGYPTVCDELAVSDLADLADAANRPGAGEAHVMTSVIGIGSVPNLAALADAGGAGEMLLIDNETGTPNDIVTHLEELGRGVRGCEFNAPEFAAGYDPLDFQVQLGTTGSPSVVPYVQDARDCTTTAGWFFADPYVRTVVRLCPDLCPELSTSQIGFVDGCPGAPDPTVCAVPSLFETHFAPTGLMGDGQIHVSEECDVARSGGVQGTCFQFDVEDSGNWAGVTWQHPERNWGEEGFGCDLSAGAVLRFKARGAIGGEEVVFAIQGYAGPEVISNLTTEWVEYSFDLTSTGEADDIWGALAMSVVVTQPFTFYLDDLTLSLE